MRYKNEVQYVTYSTSWLSMDNLNSSIANEVRSKVTRSYTEDTWEYATNSWVRDQGTKRFADYNKTHESTSNHEESPIDWPWAI